jgi:hypothetical protein
MSMLKVVLTGDLVDLAAAWTILRADCERLPS